MPAPRATSLRLCGSAALSVRITASPRSSDWTNSPAPRAPLSRCWRDVVADQRGDVARPLDRAEVGRRARGARTGRRGSQRRSLSPCSGGVEGSCAPATTSVGAPDPRQVRAQVHPLDRAAAAGVGLGGRRHQHRAQLRHRLGMLRARTPASASGRPQRPPRPPCCRPAAPRRRAPPTPREAAGTRPCRAARAGRSAPARAPRARCRPSRRSRGRSTTRARARASRAARARRGRASRSSTAPAGTGEPPWPRWSKRTMRAALGQRTGLRVPHRERRAERAAHQQDAAVLAARPPRGAARPRQPCSQRERMCAKGTGRTGRLESQHSAAKLRSQTAEAGALRGVLLRARVPGALPGHRARHRRLRAPVA